MMAPRQIKAWLGKRLSAIIKGTSWEIARVLLEEMNILPELAPSFLHSQV